MKLLLITSSAPFGKGESFVITEANAIAKTGVHVTLVPALIRDKKSNSFKINNSIEVLCKPLVSFDFLLNFMVFFAKNPKKCFSLIRLINDKKVSNKIKNFLILPKAIWLASYAEKESIDHIHAHWLTTSSTLALLVSELTGIQWSATAHRGDIVANNILDIKFKKSKFIRFISKSGIELASKRVKTLHGKEKVIHLGIDFEEIGSPVFLAPSPSSRTLHFCCPANLIPVKGHSFLIESINKMKLKNNIKLTIVGDGDLRQQLESKVKQLNLNSIIEFSGHIPHSDLLDWYKTGNVDAVILPSLDLGYDLHEGIPVSLMEAMAYHIPVVSTRTGGIPELLEENNELYGSLVNPNNVEELAYILDDFVQDPEKYQHKATLGYQRVLTKFNQKKSVSELIKLFELYI